MRANSSFFLQHFLGNVDLINQTLLFEVATKMPKGAHLHIHFNSCLPARFLIEQARDVDAMYIRRYVKICFHSYLGTELFESVLREPSFCILSIFR
jgi:hypothetical protein